MKKTMRKLIPAVLMLLISAMLVGTSTYAWFSMNNKVTVTGMTVRTKVSENLLIAPDTLASTAKVAEASFKNADVQTISGILEPVSTTDGESFFYTDSKNVLASGDAINDAYIAYAENDTFDANYGFTTNSVQEAYGYKDYVVQLKAINGPNDAEIRLTALNLVYGGTADAGKAYRVAMFVEDITSADPSGDVGTLTTIFTESGAANFTSGKAVKTTSTLDTVTYCSANTTAVISVPHDTTKYFKVVLRLWLEGEDNTCNNATYMNLTDDWALDVEFQLVRANAVANAVININKTVTAAKTALLTTDTVNTSSNQVIINGVTYYQITGKTLNTKQLYVMTDTTLATTSRIFTIVDSTYPTEVTNQVTITTAP